MFTGSLVALITPFKNGSVDEKGFEKFVAWQIKEGTDGLVPCGTTGESPTLSMRGAQAGDRHLHRRGQGHGRAGDRRHRLELDRRGDRAHAATPRRPAPTPPCWSCPITTSRPRKACSSTSRRWPRRSTFRSCSTTCRRAPAATCRSRRSIRLSQVKNIIGIKDASYDMARPTLTRLKAKKGFIQLSGEDASAMGFLAQGGDGCISVTANVAPRLCGDMHDAWKARDLDKVFEIQDRLMPLHKAMFVRDQPRPGEVRRRADRPVQRRDAPAAGAESPRASKKAVREAMVHAGLIN